VRVQKSRLEYAENVCFRCEHWLLDWSQTPRISVLDVTAKSPLRRSLKI